MRWKHVFAFPAFVCGVCLLATLAILLMGNGILVRETVWQGRINCRYLTLKGMITKEFDYGDINFGRWRCGLVTDPDQPF